MAGDLTWLQPGAIVLDDSFSPPNEDQLTEGRDVYGVRAEIRYASTPTSNPKNLQRQRVELLHGLGLGALMIHEQAATDHQGGAAAGAAKADVFAAHADRIGYPRSAPALVACDSSPTADMVAYLSAFDERVRALGWTLTGVYGGVDLVEMAVNAGRCTDVLWQAYGWSALTRARRLEDDARSAAIAAAQDRWGAFATVAEAHFSPEFDEATKLWRVTAQAVHDRAHAFQRLGYEVLDGGPFPPGQVDENVVLRPFPVWLPGGLPLPPSGDDMTYALATVRLPDGNLAGAAFRATIDATGKPRDLVWLATADKLARCTDPARELALAEVALCAVDRVPVGDHAFVAATGRDWAPFDFLNEPTAGATGPAGKDGAPGRDGVSPTAEAVADELARRPLRFG